MAKSSYSLYKELSALIEETDLNERQKNLIKTRVAGQLDFYDKRATRARNRNFRLRIIGIVASIIVPTIINLNIPGDNEKSRIFREVVLLVASGLSLTGAISIAVHDFLKVGVEYTHYRQFCEEGKTYYFRYLSLTDKYKTFANHDAAYKEFTAQMENLFRQESSEYVEEVLKPKEEDDEEEKKEQALSQLQDVTWQLSQTIAQRPPEPEPEPLPSPQDSQISWEENPQEITLTQSESVTFWDDTSNQPGESPFATSPTSSLWGEATPKEQKIEYLTAEDIKKLVGKNNNTNGQTTTSVVTIVNSQPSSEITQLSDSVLKVVPGDIRKHAEKSVPLLLQECENCQVSDRGQIAYILATTEHESKLGLWMEELASGSAYEGRRDLGNTQPGDGVRFKGRGYTQITGRVNYQRWSDKLGIDLISQPEKAAEPKIAARIIVQAMKEGSFTGVGLSKYINGQARDFRNARRIINGLDRADHIAKIAQRYYSAIA